MVRPVLQPKSLAREAKCTCHLYRHEFVILYVPRDKRRGNEIPPRTELGSGGEWEGRETRELDEGDGDGD
jgi:hypothetical protein